MQAGRPTKLGPPDACTGLARYSDDHFTLSGISPGTVDANKVSARSPLKLDNCFKVDARPKCFRTPLPRKNRQVAIHF